MALPPLLPVETIQQCLEQIFPNGMAHRNYVTREMAARTVFVMLYIGAIEGSEQWLGPKHVYSMSESQAGRQAETDRRNYAELAYRPRFQPRGQPWFKDNTREPIRDETLKQGFMQVGASVARPVPTTSSLPRYALRSDFAALFDPDLTGSLLDEAIRRWQESHLTGAALGVIRLRRRNVAASGEKVTVIFPNKELRQLEPGPSSLISKAVIEHFAPQFLREPGVVLLSESGNKIIDQENALIQDLGLKLEISELLPDIILFDLHEDHPLLVFVEVVATSGAMTQARMDALLNIAASANFRRDQVAFVTAYLARNLPEFRSTVASLPWESFVWFASEPEGLFSLKHDVASHKIWLSDLVR